MSKTRIITLAIILTILPTAIFATNISAEGNGFQFRHLNMENSSLSHDFATCVVRDSTGFIWIGTTNGLNRFDGHSMTPFYKGDLSLPGSVILDLCLDKDRRMWVKTTDGTCRYDFRSDRFVPEETGIFEAKDSLMNFRKNYLTKTLGFGKGNRDIFIRYVTIDSRGRFWIATNLGIYVHDVSNGTTLHIRHDENDPFSLSDDRVSSIFLEAEGDIWITTDTGVNYADRFSLRLRRFTSADGVPLRQSFVNGVSQGNDGKIWVSTENAGVFYYDMSKGKFFRFSHPALPRVILGMNCIDGELWVRTQTGLLRIFRDGRSREYRRSLDGNLLRQCRAICKVPRNDRLLLATKNGLFQYDKNRDGFEPIEEFRDIFIENVTEVSSGEVWLSCYKDGAIRWNPRTGETTSFPHDDNDPGSMACDRVVSCTEASDGSIWFSTFGCGLARMNPDGSFTTWNSHNLGPDFTNDLANEIVEDNGGFFWISTYRGLLRFNPATHGVCPYTVGQGFLNNEYAVFSCIHLPNDDIMIGSRDGIVMFNAGEFTAAPENSRIVITDFLIDGLRVSPGDSGSPIDRNIDLVRKVTLNPSQNSFAFKVSLLKAGYSGNRIEYRLKGWNDKWAETGSDGVVSFSNIPHGKYALEIRKGQNPDNAGVTHPEIEITVRPPLYLRAWAILAYIAGGILLVALIVFCALRLSARKTERRRLEERLETDMENMKEKMMFLSNVVHEIKTPLTLIKSPVSNIRKTHPDDVGIQNDLKIIDNSASYLTSLSNELLEYVRVEQKGYILEKGCMNLTDKLKELLFNYSETAGAKGIVLETRIPSEAVWICADKPAVNKIVNNLLINAIKYCSSRIFVSLDTDGNSVTLTVGNDGEPIPEEWKERIFRPFMRASGVKLNKVDGIGLGLPLARSLAEMNSGSLVLADNPGMTEFRLTFPTVTPAETAGAADGSTAGTEPGEVAGNDAAVQAARADRVNILVAEDNDGLRGYLASQLAQNYNVFTAEDGLAAIGLLREKDIALVVSDVAMPQMDGVELCRTIRKDMDISHVMIILTSGRNDMKLKLACMESGANLYMEKPLDMDYLRACIANLLDKKNMMQKALRNSLSMSEEEDFSLSRQDREFLGRIDKVIMENINDPALAVEQLETEVNMSSSSLLRKFRRLLNTTPNNYIRTKRLLLARKMFDEGEDRISDVCYSCGFNSTSYFAKCFREYFGCAPAEYMKKIHINTNKSLT